MNERKQGILRVTWNLTFGIINQLTIGVISIILLVVLAIAAFIDIFIQLTTGGDGLKSTDKYVRLYNRYYNWLAVGRSTGRWG